mmetsp:Transcript_32271/g.86089  ORF Transcript_32271/g.86089 Transcript_32271/m.86089 type:complete len:189 (+) Transcript_32271:27-593(+)
MKTAVQKVLALQEERAKAYGDFEVDFRSYAKGGSDELYMEGTKDVTARFQSISSQINAVVASLQEIKSHEASQLCGWLTNLQRLEKEKLRITVVLHFERKRQCQIEERLCEPDKHGEEKKCNCFLRRNTTNFQGGDDVFELAMQESKVKQLQRQLDETITDINEILDEVRYFPGDDDQEDASAAAAAP